MRVRIKVPVLRNMTSAKSHTFRPDSYGVVVSPEYHTAPASPAPTWDGTARCTRPLGTGNRGGDRTYAEYLRRIKEGSGKVEEPANHVRRRVGQDVETHDGMVSRKGISGELVALRTSSALTSPPPGARRGAKEREGETHLSSSEQEVGAGTDHQPLIRPRGPYICSCSKTHMAREVPRAIPAAVFICDIA